MSNGNLSPDSSTRKAFVAHFQKLVVPLLRNHILGQARCVAAGVLDFASAWSSAWQYAISRGALHLGSAELEALEDWVGTTLLTDVCDAELDGWGAWPHMGERANGG